MALSRFSVRCIASVLFGVIHMFIHPSGAGYFMVPFHDSVMAYGFVGVAGFFAHVPFVHARTSSTALNVVTASFITLCQLWFPCDWVQLSVHRLYSQQGSSPSKGFFGFSMNFVVTLVVTLVLLVPIYVKRSLYIPKGTRFLSRREQSHL